MANTVTPSDVEVGFFDDIPVVRADGSVEKLGDVDTTEVEVTPKSVKAAAKTPKTPKAKAEPAVKPVPKSAGKAGAKPAKKTPAAKAPKAPKEPKAKTPAQIEKETAAQKRKDDAQAKKDLIAKNKKDREDRIAKAKADREQRAEQRKLDDAKRAADKLARQGLTGDADKDAEFVETVEESKALAVRPVDLTSLDLGFLDVPGVQLSKVGLILPEDYGLNTWAHTVASLQGAKDVTQFAIGDALIFGEEHFGNQYKYVMDSMGIAESTVKNDKMVSKAWPVQDRVEGIGFTKHLIATALYRKNPAAARNILETAKYEQRPTPWVSAQVAAAMAGVEAEDVPTKLQVRREQVDALVLATNDQREADFLALKTPAARAKAFRKELVATVEWANNNDAVPSEHVLRTIARLQAENDDLRGENQNLRDEIKALREKIGSRAEAEARVRDTAGTAMAEAEAEADVVEGEIIAPGAGVSIADGDDDLLDYLGDEAEDGEEDQS